MTLEERLEEIKRQDIFEDCFKQSWFSISPILKMEYRSCYQDIELLSKASCVDFKKLTKEDIEELKNIAKRVIWSSKL